MSTGLTIVFLSVGAILLTSVSVGATDSSSDAHNNSTGVTPSPQTTAGPPPSTADPNNQTAAPNTQSDNSGVTAAPNATQQQATTGVTKLTNQSDTNPSSSNTPVPSTEAPNASTPAGEVQSTSSNGSSTVSPPTTQKASVTPADNKTGGTNAPVTTVAPTTPQPTTANISSVTVTPSPTQQPTASTAAPPAVTNGSVTTHTPSPTNGSVVTQVTPGDNTSSTTSQPDKTNGTGTNETGTTMPPSTTVKPATTGAPTGQQMMYINEIMLDRHGGFQKIELYVSNQVDLTHYAMVMVDGGTYKTMSITHLEHLQQNNSLVMVSFNNTSIPMMSSSGIGIAIYDTDQMSNVFTDSWTVSKDGLVDALVIGRTYAEIPDHLVQTLTPGMIPFVLDPSLYGNEKTITRCSAELLRSTDMFALVNPSMGRDNGLKCQERLHYQKNLELKFAADCRNFDQSTKTGQVNTKHLMHFVIKEVNKKCHCGMTRMHIKDPKVSCCGGTSLDMKFVAPNQHQGDALLTNYKSFIQSTSDVKISGNQTYKLDNSCYSNCCSSPVPSKGDDKSKNMKVTVAVIVTCMLVFMVIVILVVLYMRRKKTAVYQFRMSRLTEEEEDYPMGVGDQDEFVGGQEATFDIKA